MRTGVQLALGLCSAAIACAACDSELGSRAELARAITGGTVTTGDPAVVAFVERATVCGVERATVCTGTVVGPRAILTAAHCVADDPTSALVIVSGPEVSEPAEQIGIAGRVVHPDYDGFLDDVAVVALATPIAATPLSLRDQPLDDSWLGREVRMVGYGADDDGVLGVKRQGAGIIDAVDDTTFRVVPGPAMSCGGDSGGPVLLAPDADSPEQIAGIVSYGDPVCLQSGTNTRVDAYLAAWIEPVLADVAAEPLPAQRPALDSTIDYCAAACAADTDCPAGLECVEQESGERLCALLGGDVGVFGDACITDADCGPGACLTGLAGDLCQCFTACDARDSGPDCSCAAGSRSDGGGAALMAAVLVLIGWRRRS